MYLSLIPLAGFHFSCDIVLVWSLSMHLNRPRVLCCMIVWIECEWHARLRASECRSRSVAGCNIVHRGLVSLVPDLIDVLSRCHRKYNQSSAAEHLEVLAGYATTSTALSRQAQRTHLVVNTVLSM